MKIKIIKELNYNIKYPKYLKLNNKKILFGIEPLINDSNLTYFNIIYNNIDDNYNIKHKHKNLNIFDKSNDLNLSLLLRNIKKNTDNLELLIEDKSIETKYMQNKNYIITTDYNFNTLNINHIKNFDNHLIFNYNFNNLILTSKIEKKTNNYWGKYLFKFYNKKNNISYKPNFDKYINYKNDNGHLLHYIEKIKNKYIIIFSIRIDTYKIYYAYSEDLVNFYNTTEFDIENNITDSQWYCYPEIIKENNKYFILLNQDDFGKSKKIILGELIL